MPLFAVTVFVVAACRAAAFSPTAESVDVIRRMTSSAGLRGDVYRTVDALERLAQFLDIHRDLLNMDHALGVAIAEGQVAGVLRGLSGAVEGVAAPAPAERAALAVRLASVRGSLDAVLRALRVTLPRALPRALPVGNDNADAKTKRRFLQPWLWGTEPGRGLVGPAPCPARDSQRRAGNAGSAGNEADVLPSAQTLLELRELSGRWSPSESESGRCIDALLEGGGGGGLGAQCRVSEGCVRAETTGPTSGYATTHRLLFHHVANQVGCMLPSQSVGTEATIARLCRSIVEEAEDIARAHFPPLLRDLFAEQVALCGLRGFATFARQAWLNRLLSWQRPAGCFGNVTELQEAVRPFESLRDNARLDDPLGNECLSHLTAVSTAAVAFNLRVLVQRWACWASVPSGQLDCRARARDRLS